MAIIRVLFSKDRPWEVQAVRSLHAHASRPAGVQLRTLLIIVLRRWRRVPQRSAGRATRLLGCFSRCFFICLLAALTGRWCCYL
jgi:hypothetical protein